MCHGNQNIHLDKRGREGREREGGRENEKGEGGREIKHIIVTLSNVILAEPKFLTYEP